jgi:hypothetical protein
MLIINPNYLVIYILSSNLLLSICFKNQNHVTGRFNLEQFSGHGRGHQGHGGMSPLVHPRRD